MQHIKRLNESLIRKNSLKQLTDIDNLMDLDGNKNDIGELTTYQYPVHQDSNQCYDDEADEVYDRSNEIIGTYGWGQMGEFFGDMTNSGTNANVIYARNPLHNDYMANYEDFGTSSNWGDWWKNRPGKEVKKMDFPDTDLADGIDDEWNQGKLTQRQSIKPSKNWLWDRNENELIHKFDKFDKMTQKIPDPVIPKEHKTKEEDEKPKGTKTIKTDDPTWDTNKTIQHFDQFSKKKKD